MNRRQRKAREMGRRWLRSHTAACTCGFWPHDLDCGFLASLAVVRSAGRCVQCGMKLNSGVSWEVPA